MERNFELLKEVLSVPTKTYQEGLMVEFICEWLEKNDIPFYIDQFNNVYALKQTNEDVEYFPCVVAHTDTVHAIDTINVREEMLPNAQKEIKLALKAYNDNGNPTGIGGDDKCGVYGCLELLKELPNLKAAFFVAEETGCKGSFNSDSEFFENVGYVIQFDAPENNMISEFLMSKPMFNRDSQFFEVGGRLITEHFPGDVKYQHHPYTDIYPLNQRYGISCFNISIGYYNYHTKNEYVVVDDTYNGIKVGKLMIEELGYSKH
jgi:putative aminopeptidase FrvX